MKTASDAPDASEQMDGLFPEGMFRFEKRMRIRIDGYQVKLVSDSSCGSLWEVSFTLIEI